MSGPAILVAIKGLGIGGAEKLIAESASMWDRDRFDYRVVYALPWKDQLVAPIEALGIPVTCIGTGRGMTPSAWWRLRKEAATADLVHAHLPAMGAVARVFAGRPVVYTEHNVASSYRGPVRWANRLTYRANAALTTVSAAVAASVAGYPGPEPRVVPNGVSCEVPEGAPQRVRHELAIDSGTPLVVHVGNIRPHKGHANLVAAVPHLLAAHPDATVVSIGGEKHDGDLDRVRGLADNAGVSGRLRFLGRRPDAIDFIAAADVFVDPADFEGLPVAVLEAMALARPVVATAVGGVPGLVHDGETGLLVPPGDPAALAAAVARVLDDPDLGSSIGAAGAKLVEAEHSLEAMVRQIESIYDEVLGA
jgi:glycosyltransferase involved in cell wall biosynthesis